MRQDLAFLPTNLLSEILAKEFKAIEEMKALEEVVFYENDKFEENGNAGFINLKNRLSVGSDVYFMEKPMDSRMSLCCHGRVSLDSVFKGEVKAVQFTFL